MPLAPHSLPAALLAFAAALPFATPAFADDEELPPTRRFFDTYDRDGDGAVVPSEFDGESTVFRLLDRDGDGRIAPGELGLPADYTPRPRSPADARERDPRRRGPGDRDAPGGRPGDRLRQALERMDADGDGRVAREEWQGPEAAFDRFDRNGDGAIDAEDLRAGADGDRRGALTAEQIEGRFGSLDADGDGALTEGEVNARVLEGTDGDGDGRVTLDEFREAVRRRREGGGRAGARIGDRMLRRFDRDGDGRVSREEFPGSDERFARLDRDGDGVFTAADLAEPPSRPEGAPTPENPTPEEPEPAPDEKGGAPR